MSMVIRTANEKDIDKIVKLLNQGKLSTEGVGNHIGNFVVVENVDNGEIVGTAGLEKINATIGILRSLVIREPAGNTQMVLGLIKILLLSAVQQGIEDVYLLTKSTSLFNMLGFMEVKAENLPALIRRSSHFSQYQPGLSTVMVYKKVDKLLNSNHH